MLDGSLRRIIDPPLVRLAAPLIRSGISANTVTIAGFIVGLVAMPLIAMGSYGLGLAAILLNRLADGLDGTIARRHGATDLGGYLDIVCDFIFYGAVAFGFALAQPESLLPAAFLLLSFIGTGSSFLAFAAVAGRRNLSTAARGPKSLYYLGGLTEGTETILFFVLCCLFPGAFGTLAWMFGVACWITTLTRATTAWRTLR